MAERLLTDADVEAIANAVKGHSHCNLNLTVEEAVVLKKLIRAFNGGANIIGTLVLTAVVGVIIAVVGKGFWSYLSQGLKAFFVSK